MEQEKIIKVGYCTKTKNKVLKQYDPHNTDEEKDWLCLHNETVEEDLRAVEEFEKKQKEKTPVEQLSEDLKSDPAYWDTWVANIAMCIYDEYTDEIPDPLIGRISHADLLRIANRGAERFLRLLTTEKKTTEDGKS